MGWPEASAEFIEARDTFDLIDRHLSDIEAQLDQLRKRRDHVRRALDVAGATYKDRLLALQWETSKLVSEEMSVR